MSAQNKSLDTVRDHEMARCLADTYESVFYSAGPDNEWLKTREGGFKVGFELAWSACLKHLQTLAPEFDEDEWLEMLQSFQGLNISTVGVVLRAGKLLHTKYAARVALAEARTFAALNDDVLKAHKEKIKSLQERAEAAGRLSASAYASAEALVKRRDELQDNLAAAEAEIQKAVSYLRQGKAKLSPNSTNSFVDDFISKHSKVGIPEEKD